MEKIIALLFCFAAYGERQSLPFDLVKNGVTVLPTQIRYSIAKDGSISVGGFDFNKSSLKIVQIKGQLKASWPEGIFEAAQVEVFSEKKALLSRRAGAEKELAFSLDQKNSKQLYFCVSDAVAKPSAKICSQFYQLSSGKLSETKKKYKRKATINDQIAGPRGTLAVTPGGKPVKMRLRGRTGFYFESELKIEKREFLNLQKTKKGTFRITFRKESALPDSQPDVVEVAADSPQFKVKEPGQMPMTQELILRDLVPTEQDKVFFADANVFETYSSIARIRLEKNPKAKLTPVDGTLRDIDEEEVEWQLTDLKKNQTQRAYLSVKGEQPHPLMTYAEITRHRAYELGVHLGSLSSKGKQEAVTGSELHVMARFSWWFDDLFRMRIPWFSWQRWGYELDLYAAGQSPQASPLSYFNSSIKYRFNRGIHLLNPTFGLKSTFQILRENGLAASSFGFGLFTEFRSPSWIRFLTSWLFSGPHWIQLDAVYSPVSLDTNIKLDQNYSASLQYRYEIDEAFSFQWTYLNKRDSFTIGRDKLLNSNVSLFLLGGSYRF